MIPADRRDRMAGEVTGASIPDGIDVDDAAAYFGVTESSDIVHSMMSMERRTHSKNSSHCSEM